MSAIQTDAEMATWARKEKKRLQSKVRRRQDRVATLNLEVRDCMIKIRDLDRNIAVLEGR